MSSINKVNDRYDVSTRGMKDSYKTYNQKHMCDWVPHSVIMKILNAHIWLLPSIKILTLTVFFSLEIQPGSICIINTTILNRGPEGSQQEWAMPVKHTLMAVVVAVIVVDVVPVF